PSQYVSPDPRSPHSFPTRRSSDLRRPGPRRGAPHSCRTEGRPSVDLGCGSRSWDKSSRSWATPPSKWMDGDGRDGPSIQLDSILDRKSTRLNSSHVAISYAVFCLK